jgi:hypothetical protein
MNQFPQTEPFQFFFKFAEIFTAQGAMGKGKWKKSSTTYTVDKFFPSSSLLGASSLILFQLFFIGINGNSGTGDKTCRRCR